MSLLYGTSYLSWKEKRWVLIFFVFLPTNVLNDYDAVYMQMEREKSHGLPPESSSPSRTVNGSFTRDTPPSSAVTISNTFRVLFLLF